MYFCIGQKKIKLKKNPWGQPQSPLFENLLTVEIPILTPYIFLVHGYIVDETYGEPLVLG